MNLSVAIYSIRPSVDQSSFRLQGSSLYCAYQEEPMGCAVSP